MVKVLETPSWRSYLFRGGRFCRVVSCWPSEPSILCEGEERDPGTIQSLRRAIARWERELRKPTLEASS